MVEDLGGEISNMNTVEELEKQIEELKKRVKSLNYELGTCKGWNKKYRGALASANAILELHSIQPVHQIIHRNMGHEHEDLIYEAYWDATEL